MLAFRVLSRIPKSSLNQCRFLVTCRPPIPSNLVTNFRSIPESSNKVPSFYHPVLSTSGSRGFWFSSTASTEPSDKDANQPAQGKETETIVDGNNSSTNVETTDASADAQSQEKTDDSASGSEAKDSPAESGRKRRSAKPTTFSDSDSEDELSREDLVMLLTEKEQLLEFKHKELAAMQDKVLRSYAEMENVTDRTKREADNSKKFAIQNFAKSLLDVADNLRRASAVVKDSFSNIDQSNDNAGAVPLLKTLLEGVEMTEKQLAEVFKKYGVEKFDPMDEQFDPNRHYALFKIADSSKPAGSVASVLKVGYMLHDRILRPAEVGVTEEAPNNEAKDKTSESLKE